MIAQMAERLLCTRQTRVWIPALVVCNVTHIDGNNVIINNHEL